MTPTLWAPSRHCSDALLFSDARWAHLPPPVWMPGWVPQPAGPAVYVLEYVPLLLDDEVRWGEVICEPVAPRSPCALLFFGLVWFCAAVACTVRRAVGPTDQWEWRGGEGVRASGRVVKGIRWEGGRGDDSGERCAVLERTCFVGWVSCDCERVLACVFAGAMATGRVRCGCYLVSGCTGEPEPWLICNTSVLEYL